VAQDARLLRPVSPRIAARFILGGIEKVLLSRSPRTNR